MSGIHDQLKNDLGVPPRARLDGHAWQDRREVATFRARSSLIARSLRASGTSAAPHTSVGSRRTSQPHVGNMISGADGLAGAQSA
ncbi:hypothetical protein [Pontibacter sp. G13]|uniref:hypothetical protein n=1 Tax=Pontibacter sp. G13 TaxID=3074898 RepID=UPI00288C37A4|nr:hypothetical protein [Pontibacter sp. G13]WNJ16596.1 hypothetical protein RJD25_17160 [Pontibacter sp. G13]